LRSQEDTDWLTNIRAQTRDILQQAIGDATEIAVLDAPNQRNVGDSLIWEGELTYLRSLGLKIAYVSDLRGYDAEDVRKHLSPGAVILLHGGGNFGDLWLGHQQLRERIVDELNDFRIVQLPQSILFRDEALAARANEVLSRHPDFRLLIRDSLSMQRAAAQLPALTAQFCPDMALGFEPMGSQSSKKSLDILIIARDDHEAASGLSGIDATALSPLTIEVTDWWKHAEEPARWRRARSVARLHSLLIRARRKARRVTRLPLPMPHVRQKRLRQAIEVINRTNVEYAMLLYSRANGLVVDRLHAHVLAALLGIEHVILDNNYRKLGAVYDDYTHKLSTGRYSTDLDDAIDQIRGALKGR
jgi:pyruvyl transferase EpsO